MFKLIIVEEKNEIREALASIKWESMGIELLACTPNGSHALQMIQDKEADVILTDIDMSNLDVLHEWGKAKKPNPDAKVESYKNYIITQAKLYIQKRYFSPITLKEIAQYVHVSPNYLSVLFKNTGESYLHYVTKVRMERATELLANPRYKVYEIGEMVGYMDSAHFSEVFKKYSGKNPIDYRNIITG